MNCGENELVRGQGQEERDIPAIKICGLTRPEDVEAVNAVCPEYAGFVFARSRRQVTPERAATLRSLLRPGIIPVGVFVDEEPQVILRLLERDIIEMAQLHGNEDEEMVRLIKERSGRPVIKAVRVKEGRDLLAWKDSEADYLLFDGGKGDGKPFDWRLAGAARRCGKPFFLAGGLREDNVSEGMSLFSPYGLDVSSGVEETGPSGTVKSPEKIAGFVRTVREWRKGAL